MFNGFGSPYLRGDANLDGVVDGSDFGLWNSHKFTSTLLWDQGNFNGDDAVDGSDFGIWNSNKFTSSDGASTRTGAGDRLDVPPRWSVVGRASPMTADWPRLDLVKIDAERAEGQVWAGMRGARRRFPGVVTGHGTANCPFHAIPPVPNGCCIAWPTKVSQSTPSSSMGRLGR